MSYRHDTPKLCSTLGFPFLIATQAASNYADAYTRSLMYQGHGFPLWVPRGTFPRNHEHIHKGVGIGDVGVIDNLGTFKFLFNVFLPPDHPIHVGRTPREFCPIDPPLDPSEVLFIPDYFKPGTVFCSQGISATKHCADPTDVSFKSKAKEGGVLILPHGVSREDLINTDRLHEYIQRNAPHWYQYVNTYGNAHWTNGTLVVVTGCDKTKEYANATFINEPRRLGKATNMRYTWEPKFRRPWSSPAHVEVSWYAPLPRNFGNLGINIPDDDPTKHQCVFMRTLRVSLSTHTWLQNMPVFRQPSPYISFVFQRKPLLEHVFDIMATRLGLIYPESELVTSRVSRTEMQIFHPNIFLAQIFLSGCPKADVSLINDFTWSALVHGERGTLSNVWDLVDKVLDTHEVIVKHGCLTLIPKPVVAEKSHLSNLIHSVKAQLKAERKPRVPAFYMYRWRRIFEKD